MRVNVIGKSNGVGLSRDMELMANILRECGGDVDVTAIDSHQSHQRRSPIMQFGVQLQRVWRKGFGGSRTPEYDLNVMLEHIWTQFFDVARCNIVVPNPEWFDRHDLRFLSYVDHVWAKTLNTQRIFERLESNVLQIGFDSEDCYRPEIARERVFFHLAGKSTMKGTLCLLDLWRRHPEWPKLLVVQHAAKENNNASADANIEIHTEYLEDTALKSLQNRCLFHLCTSETEGWGHYLVEALSVGAITITLDAPPMNELVTSERGLLLMPCQTRRQKLAKLYLFDETALVAVVQQAMTMNAAEISSRSTAARQWFLMNKEGFGGRIKGALNALNI